MFVPSFEFRLCIFTANQNAFEHGRTAELQGSNEKGQSCYKGQRLLKKCEGNMNTKQELLRMIERNCCIREKYKLMNNELYLLYR